LDELDKKLNTDFAEKKCEELEQEVTTLFKFDYHTFTFSSGSNYSNPSLNREEPPYHEHNDDIQHFLRKCIEIIRMNWDIIQTKNPYQTEQQMYNLVHNILPKQFDFNYEEHKKSFPLHEVTSYFTSSGMKEVNISGNTVWAFPHNINEKEKVCVTSIFEFQGESILYVFGEELLLSFISYLRLTIFEIFNRKK